MSITLVLAERNAAALNALLAKTNAALTPAQFAAQYSPGTATVDAIRTWAAANHLTVASVSSNRLLVTLSGSSGQ
ncbi:MAG: protease pro-enzyme activation domain-containing protein, partial [Gemmatimonadales bacterium]